MITMTPEQRQKYLNRIEQIEHMQRPDKWKAIRKLVLELNPELKKADDEFSQACKEWRQASASQTGASQQLNIRNTMKLPDWLYPQLIKFDPELKVEMSGRNHGHQLLIGKQLYKAFPEYRIARSF
ncbi:hypothetical protein [Caudoviricetes sp.]|nr:hypothetical protein [Caudoviricetes sp.]